jgi:hypothetical protein
LVLLKLAKPVNIRKYPPFPLTNPPSRIGTEVIGVGYGIDAQPVEPGTPPSAVLASMIFRGFFDIPTNVDRDGRKVSRPTRPSVMIELGEGRDGQISCARDSGSPQMIEQDGQYSVFGITSHLLSDRNDGSLEDRCAKGETVRVVPVMPYLQWIKDAARRMGTRFEE